MTIRIVIDTNIYASALMKPTSLPGKVLYKVIQDHQYELVVSEEILVELKRILFYPKVRKRINGSDEDVSHWIGALIVIAHVVTLMFQYDTFNLEDPDDEKFLIAASKVRQHTLSAAIPIF